MEEKLSPSQKEAIQKVVDELIDYFKKKHEEEHGISLKAEIPMPRIRSVDPWSVFNKHWVKIERRLIQDSLGVQKGTGRPRANVRKVLEGVLWYLDTKDAKWSDIPKHFPPHQTCHRYYLIWKKSGILDTLFAISDFEPKNGF